MIKEKELPKAVVNNKLITHKATDLTIMSYDKNVHKLIIPTDLTQDQINDIIVLITFRYHENIIQISGDLVEDKIEIILPNEIRSLSGEFYIEIDINLTDNRQITFARYRANVVKSDIDSVDLDDAQEFYFELFDDFVQKVADKSDVAVSEIDAHKQSVSDKADATITVVTDANNSVTSAKQSALTSITQATSDVTDASTQFTADLADTQSTIDAQVAQAQDSLQEVSDTLTAVNDKVTTVNDTADSFMADVATKQSDVTSKYNAFDASVTTSGQTIDSTIANINAKNTQVNTLASDFTADVATKQSDVTSKYNAFDTSVTQAGQTIDSTIANINAKNTQVNTLASDFTADVATKQSDVTSKYNAFDASVTTSGQTIDEILGLADDVQQIADDVLDLKIFVNQPNADIFGVEVDVENRTFTRLLGAVGKTAGTDFDNVKAFGGRRRCNVTDSGVVTAYFGETGYTETGALTEQVGTHAIGTKVQVMVEQPKFYYRTVPIKLEPISGGIGYHLRKARYYISDTPRAGFTLHPAFISNGEELDALYLSAYEGSLYDESTASYILDDAQVADFAADRLSSIAGVKPASGLTQALHRANARLLAQKRGPGWQQQYAATAAATQLLGLIELNTFNWQTAIGAGVSNKPDGTGNEAEPTGVTGVLGNKTGVAKTLNGYDAISYRGEENFYGNIWTFVDGLNPIANSIHQFYVADNDFAEKKDTGSYKNAGFTLAKTNGYVSAFGYSEAFDWLFLPSETLGNSSVPAGDSFGQNYAATDDGGWRTAYLGGRWHDGAYVGGFYWNVANYSAAWYRSIGARSVYAKKKAVV